MILIDDLNYKETLQILRGNRVLPGIYIELKEWLAEEYDIAAVNFIFEKMQYNNPENRHRLYILLSSTLDYQKMMKNKNLEYDKNKQRVIGNKFLELAKKYNFCEQKELEDLWVCYNDFSIEIKSDANNMAMKEAEPYIKAKYAGCSLWNIYTAFSSAVVFYEKDSHININSENGISDMLKQDYFALLKKYDEFDVYKYDEFIMNFDSRENLDRNYQGNLYYYFK